MAHSAGHLEALVLSAAKANAQLLAVATHGDSSHFAHAIRAGWVYRWVRRRRRHQRLSCATFGNRDQGTGQQRLHP